MAGAETMRAACRQVKPLMSTDFWEARRRALALYKAFYRFTPYIGKFYYSLKSYIDLIIIMNRLFVIVTYLSRSRNLRQSQPNLIEIDIMLA